MELKINGGVPLDLSSDEKVVIDYELFSDKAQNLVSTLTGLNLPSTDKNIAGIDVTQKQSVELSSEFGRSFLGKIKADSQTFNSVSDTISLTFYEKLKTIFDEMDIDVGAIGNDGDTFDWNFDINGNVPLTPTSGKWFLTGGDFNGFSANGESFYDIPIYPAKVISHINQMFWTIDLFSFLDKTFKYYSIDDAITANDIIFGSTKLSELYMFIPVTKFVCTDRELSKRKVVANCDLALKTFNDGRFQFKKAQAIVGDGIEQTYMDGTPITITNSIIGTSDTKYDITVTSVNTVSGSSVGVDSGHKLSSGGNVAIPLGTFGDKTQGDVDAVFEILNNGGVIHSINLGQIFDGVSGSLNTTIESTVDTTLSPVELDLITGDDITFKLQLDFKGYYFYDNASGLVVEDDLKVLNGKYTYDDLDILCENVLPPTITVQTSFTTTEWFSVLLTPIDQLVPIRREYDYDGFVIEDEIDIDASLSHTQLKVKDILADINKRYALGYWVDSNGDINISNVNSRYKTTSPVSLYESNGEPYTVDYKIDIIGKFTYKNDTGGITGNEIEDNKDYAIGDIVEYEAGNGDTDISINMNSATATNQIFGNSVSGSDLPYLDANTNFFFWGYSNNEQLLPSNIPVMHGYLSPENVLMNVRLPHAAAVNTGTDADVDWQVLPVYTKNGNREMIYRTDTVTPILSNEVYGHPLLYYPVHTNLYDDSVLLADDDGIIDTTTALYNNFEYMLDGDQSTITIEAVLDHAEVGKLLDGNVGQINGLITDVANFIVLQIEGFIFDQERSVVQLIIKKYVNYL